MVDFINYLEDFRPKSGDQNSWVDDMLQCVSKVKKNLIKSGMGLLNLLSTVVCLGGLSTSVAAYSVIELNPVSNNFEPWLNDNDRVVWFGLDVAEDDYDIFYYDGSATTKVVNNSFNEYSPKINNNNIAVWYGNSGGEKIFSYSGSGVPANISGKSGAGDFRVGLSPQINSADNVVWFGHEGGATGNDNEIYFYDGTVTAITSNTVEDKEAQLNDNGLIVWQRDDGTAATDWNIYVYDTGAASPTQVLIGSDVGDDEFPQVNNAVSPQVVWRHDTGSNFIIQLWSSDTNTTNTISDGSSVNNKWPQLNDNGDVVWQGFDGNDQEIYLYSGGVVQQLTNNDYDDLEPQINTSGRVAWRGRPEADSEVFVWDGSSILQVSNDNCENINVRINDNNTLVWQAKDGAKSRIILALDNPSGNPPASILCAVTSASSSTPDSSRKADSGGCALNTRAGFDPVLVLLLAISTLYVWRKQPLGPR